jgi:ribonuclease D
VDRKLQINWAGIWKSMAISPGFEKTLVLAAKEMKEVLNDPTRPQKNVSEWAKTENCWKQAKARKISLAPEFEAELQVVTGEMKREARSNEKASGQALNEVEKLTKLIGVDPKVWDNLLASPRLSVSPIEAGVLKVLKKDGYVSEKQADKLFELIQRAEAEGIKVF